MAILSYASDETASQNQVLEEESITLQIYRSDEFINRSLIPTVYVDDKAVGQLENGQSLIVKLPIGKYTIAFLGEFPDWLPSYNKEIEIDLNDMSQTTYLKLDPIFTGVITPTEAKTSFELFIVEKVYAEQETSTLGNNTSDVVFHNATAEVAALETN